MEICNAQASSPVMGEDQAKVADTVVNKVSVLYGVAVDFRPLITH